MEFDAKVDFLGFEQKTIKKGDKAGQMFYVVRFVCGNDTIEVMIFSDRADLITTILKAERYQHMLAHFKLTENSGNLKLSLLELVTED